MLNAENKKKIIRIIPAYLVLSLLDLIGVILIATCGTISYNLISGETRPSRVELILQSLWPSKVESAQLLFFFSIISAIFLTIKTVFTSLINYRVIYWLAKQETSFSTSLFSSILNAPLGDVKAINPGEAQWAIMLGSSRLMSGVVTPIISVLGDLITILVLVTTVFFATPNIALAVTLLFLVSHKLFKHLLKSRMHYYGSELSKKGSLLHNQIQHTFQAKKEIKVFGLSKQIEEVFSRDRDLVSLLGQKSGFLNNLFRYYLELSILLSAFLVVIIELYFSDTRQAITSLILFLSVGFRTIPSLQRLQAINLSLQLSQGMTKSYFELRSRFLQLEAEYTNQESPEAQIHIQGPIQLDLNNISYSGSNDENLILDNITFRIEAGEFLVVFGKSGSGKTTLIDIISTLLEPNNGVVTFKNEEGLDLKPKRDYIGYCAQTPYIFNTSLTQNLIIANNLASETSIRYLVDQLNLSELDKLESKDNQVPLAERLSGGERQRIGIARALLSSRPILIFDEPTSSLDQTNTDSFLNIIQKYKRRHTLIIVTHDAKIARLSDKVIVLEDGRIAFQGNPKEFQFLR